MINGVPEVITMGGIKRVSPFFISFIEEHIKVTSYKTLTFVVVFYYTEAVLKW